MYLGRFVHTESGKLIMSILLGFGLASLFRTVCKKNNCMIFLAPPMGELKDKIYKNNGKCVKYSQVATKCVSGAKTVTFE